MNNITDKKTLHAINLLVEKAKMLSRVPQKTDFDNETACFIKQKLGPWPRALEKAGLKEAVGISAKEKSKLKRERIKKQIKSQKSNSNK